MGQLLKLKYHSVSITDDLVRTVFNDGTHVDLDITQSHNEGYKAAAYFWGYDDHVLYAKHHDLTHCWLSDRVFDRPSPTLWARAHNLPPPPENRDEEHLVNTTQYTIATGKTGLYKSFFQSIFGVGWTKILNTLQHDYRGIGLPFPGITHI